MPLTHVVFHGSGTKGERVVADPLTRCPGNTIGSMPRRAPDWPTGWECVVSSGQTSRWARAHLLHGPSSPIDLLHLHGPGQRRDNIIISDKSINGSMFTRAEGDAIRRIRGLHQVLSYEVRVNHFTGAYPRPFFAESVHIRYGRKNPMTGAVTPIFDDDITSRVGHQPPACAPTPPTTPTPPTPPTTPTGPIFAGPSTGPTIGPAPSGPVRPMPMTGLCHTDKISCAARDFITRYTFPDRDRAVRLELEALLQHCRILQPFDAQRRQFWLTALRQLAEQRVDDFITWWRVDMDRIRLRGPCP